MFFLVFDVVKFVVLTFSQLDKVLVASFGHLLLCFRRITRACLHCYKRDPTPTHWVYISKIGRWRYSWTRVSAKIRLIRRDKALVAFDTSFNMSDGMIMRTWLLQEWSHLEVEYSSKKRWNEYWEGLDQLPQVHGHRQIPSRERHPLVHQEHEVYFGKRNHQMVQEIQNALPEGRHEYRSGWT